MFTHKFTHIVAMRDEKCYNIHMNTAIINKKCLLSWGGFAFTLLFGFAAMHLMQLFNLNYWVGVSVGAAILIVMLIVFIALRNNVTLPLTLSAIPVNAVASGIALSSMYEYLGYYPRIWQSAAVFATLTALFLLYCLLTDLKFFQRFYVICEITLIVLAAAAVILGMIFSDVAAFSLAAVGLIPFIAMLVSLTMRSSDAVEHVKNMSYCSFFVLAVVILVVLTVITQGDGLDGIGDGLVSDKNKKGNKSNVYDFLPRR